MAKGEDAGVCPNSGPSISVPGNLEVIFHHSYWEMQPCGVFVPSQHASKNMSNDPAACKIALFSLFQTVIIEYF